MKAITFILFFFNSLVFSMCTTKKVASIVYEAGHCPDTVYKMNFEAIRDSATLYHTKYVETSGFFKWGMEETSLSELKSGGGKIWLNFDDGLSRKGKTDTIILFNSLSEYERTRDQKIIIRGIVDTSIHGHLGQYAFTIKEICYLRTL
jgi:hypothetical protein